MKEIEAGITYELFERGGAVVRRLRLPVVEWERSEIVAGPGDLVEIRGVLKDFDGEARTDDFPAAVLDSGVSGPIPAPIVGGIVTAVAVFGMRGRYELTLFGARVDPSSVTVVIR